MQIRFHSQKLFSLHWWLMLLVTLCVAGLTTRLGFWQLGRAHFKEAAYALELKQAELAPLNTQDLLQSPLSSDSLQRRFDVQGQWLKQWTVFLENRTMQGKPGFWVFTPLQLAPEKVLLVQRGWVARDLVHSSQLPSIETPEGLVRIQGRLVAPPSKMFELQEKQSMPPEAQGLSLLRQNIDMKTFSDETGLRLIANALQTGEPSEGLLRDWPTSLSGSDKNRAYALQWFALACVCIGLFAWFQIIQKIKHD